MKKLTAITLITLSILTTACSDNKNGAPSAPQAAQEVAHQEDAESMIFGLQFSCATQQDELKATYGAPDSSNTKLYTDSATETLYYSNINMGFEFTVAATDLTTCITADFTIEG